MLYLLALFLPWLALAFVGKPIQAIISLCLYILAVIGFLFFFIPGVLLWLVSVAHAFAVISSVRADKRTRKIVDAIRDQAPAPASTSSGS